MNKFTNPLFVNQKIESKSSDIKLTGEVLDVLTPEVCPKCQSQTTAIQMADGGKAFFCDGCRVTMPAQVK
jgi:hypothetical protein